MQRRIKLVCWIIALIMTGGTLIFSALCALGIPQWLTGMAGHIR